MTRKRIAVSCLLLVSALWAGSAMAEGTIALFLGQKSFDDAQFAHGGLTAPPPPRPDGWSPVEDQAEIVRVRMHRRTEERAALPRWRSIKRLRLKQANADDREIVSSLLHLIVEARLRSRRGA